MKTTLACTAGIQTDCTDSDNFIINLCIQILHFFFISYILANHLAFARLFHSFLPFFLKTLFNIQHFGFYIGFGTLTVVIS